MFIIGNFLFAIATILDYILTIYVFIIIGRVIVSWLSANPYNRIVQFLYATTEPVLTSIRRILPSALWRTGLDFSPFVAILIIFFLRRFVIQSLLDLARYID